MSEVGADEGLPEETVTGRWEPGPAAALELAGLPPAAAVRLEPTLILGGLVRPLATLEARTDAAGGLRWAPRFTAEDLLDPAAASFLTDLTVRVRVLDGEAAGELHEAPPAALAWPAGVASAPEVWDLDTAATRAPRGVTDPAVRERLGDGDGRALPPVGLDRPGLEDDERADGRVDGEVAP